MTHLTTAAAFAITAILVSTGLASEANLVTAELLSTAGWTATGLLALAAATATFGYLQRHRRTAPRAVAVGALLLMTVGIADLAVNVWTISQVGFPGSVHWSKYGAPVGLVGCAGLLAAGHHRVRRVLPSRAMLRRLSPSVQQTAAVAFALLLVVSGVGPFASMGGVIVSDHDGTAAAGEITLNQTYIQNTNNVKATIEGPNGYQYAADNNGEIHKVDPSDMSQVSVYTGHSDRINDLVFGPNGYLYSFSSDNSIHKIDPSDMTQVNSYTTGDRFMSGDIDDTHLYAASADDVLHKIDYTDMTSVNTTSLSSFTRALVIDSNNVYVGGNSQKVRKYDKSTLSAQGSSTQMSDNVDSLDIDEYIYAGSHAGGVQKIDPSDMSTVETITPSSGMIYAVHIAGDGRVYVGDSNSNLYQIYSSNMSTDSTYSDSSICYDAIHMGSDGHLYTGTCENDFYQFSTGTSIGEPVSGNVTDTDGSAITNATIEVTNTSTGSIVATKTTDSSGSYEATVDAGDYEITATATGYASETKTVTVPSGGTTVDFSLQEAVISGQVIDQYDQPQSGVQVRGYAVDTSDQTFEEAKSELQNLSDLEPPSWKDKSEYDLESEAHNLEAEYVTVNTRDQWQLNEVGGLSGVSLTPNVVHHKDPTQPVVLSTWDPTTGGAIVNSEINGEWPGTQTDSDIVIERLDGEDDVVDRTTISQNGTKTTGILSDTRWDDAGFGDFRAGTDHSYAETTLSPGFYIIYSEKAGKDGPRTFLQVGTFDSMIDETVRNEAGNLPEQAQAIQNRLDNNGMQVLRTTTNANGRYTLDPPSGYDTVAIQTFAIQSGNVSLDEQSDMDDVRSVYQQESFSGSVTLQAEPVVTEVPDQNADVRVVTTETPPWLDLNSTQDFAERLRNYIENRSFSELPTVLQERFEEMQPEERQQLHEELRKLQNRNDRLREAYLDELEDDGYESPPDREEMTNDELRQDIQRLENTISKLQSDIDMEDGSGEVSSDGNLTYEKPLPDGVSEDSVSVIAEFNDGTSDVVNESYWRIDESVTDSDTLIVEDYPLDGAAVAKINVRVATNDDSIIGDDESGFGHDSDIITNPAFDGTTPDIDAMDFSTLEPGPDERVAMNVRAPAESSFQSVENVSVWSPNGTALDVNTSGMHDATFRTVGEGRYTIRVTYTDATGETFVETVNIKATDSQRALPASVRVQDGTTDTYALTGSGLTNGYVRDSTDGATQVGAVIEQDADVPSTVHVFTQSAESGATSEYEVRVQRGEDRESVHRHVTVDLNTRKFSEDALVWRNGDAIDAAGSSPYGVVKHNHSDKTKIRFATNEHGRATIRINNDPGRLDRLDHWWSLNRPGFLPGQVAPATALLSVVGPVTPDTGPSAPTLLPDISWPMHAPLAVTGGVGA